jgi:hypothetical protein
MSLKRGPRKVTDMLSGWPTDNGCARHDVYARAADRRWMCTFSFSCIRMCQQVMLLVTFLHECGTNS